MERKYRYLGGRCVLRGHLEGRARGPGLLEDDRRVCDPHTRLLGPKQAHRGGGPGRCGASRALRGADGARAAFAQEVSGECTYQCTYPGRIREPWMGPRVREFSECRPCPTAMCRTCSETGPPCPSASAVITKPPTRRLPCSPVYTRPSASTAAVRGTTSPRTYPPAIGGKTATLSPSFRTYPPSWRRLST